MATITNRKPQNAPTVNKANGHQKSPLNPTMGEEIYDPPRPGGPRLRKQTDITRWRMLDDEGRQTWHYLESDEEAKKWPQSIADKWYLEQPTVQGVLAAFNNTRSPFIGSTQSPPSQDTPRCG